MTKQEAADLLGCSPRQLERYTAENKIGVRYVKGRTRPTPEYDEVEVRRFKEELERPVYRPAVVSHSSEPSKATQDDSSDNGVSLLPSQAQLDALRSLFEAMMQQAPALPEPQENSEKMRKSPASLQDLAVKLFLTVDEAAAFAGVGKRALDSAIKANHLPVHRGLGQGRRIKRSDLEAWVKTL